MASPQPRRSTVLVFLVLLTLFPTNSSALTCTTQKLPDATNSNKLYSNCMDLQHLNSFLHWTHDPSNSSLSIAFVAAPPKPGGWVSWAINPTGTGMAGAQALVAYKDNGAVAVKTLDIKSYVAMVPGKLSFDVSGLRADEVAGVIRLFANVKVPEKATSLNQVWQVGPSVTAGRLDKHDFAPENLNSRGTLSLNGGQSSGGGGGAGLDSRTKRKNTHGVLNTLSWGILFPLGVIIARYMKTFPSADPAWFYLHVACQVSAFAIGVAGWGTGLKLGSESEGIVYSVHRNIGFALFCLATIQIFALFIRPKKDHKYRFFWNIYHHSFGYTIIVLGIINIFRGFDILSPEKKWKSAYIVVIAALGVTALLLEGITWIVVLKRKSSTKPYDDYNNGQSRQQPPNI